MSFLAGLFILLFTIVNSQKNSPQYFEEMSVKMGGKKVEQNKKATSEGQFVSEIRNYIQDEQMSQYALVMVDEQRIRLIFNDHFVSVRNRYFNKSFEGCFKWLTHIIIM